MWSQMGQQQHALKELAETFTVHRLRMPGFYAKGWPTNAIESLNSPFHPHAQWPVWQKMMSAEVDQLADLMGVMFRSPKRFGTGSKSATYF